MNNRASYTNQKDTSSPADERTNSFLLTSYIVQNVSKHRLPPHKVKDSLSTKVKVWKPWKSFNQKLQQYLGSLQQNFAPILAFFGLVFFIGVNYSFFNFFVSWIRYRLLSYRATSTVGKRYCVVLDVACAVKKHIVRKAVKAETVTYFTLQVYKSDKSKSLELVFLADGEAPKFFSSEPLSSAHWRV